LPHPSRGARCPRSPSRRCAEGLASPGYRAAAASRDRLRISETPGGRVHRSSKQSLSEQQATRGLLAEKVEQACAGWGCRLTDKGLGLLNQGLTRLWPRVDEDRVLEDAEARIAQLQHFHREAAMSSSSFTELCARFPEIFFDYTVKALWEDDGLLAVHKPWGMRAYLARRDGEKKSGGLRARYRAWPEELTAHDLLQEICEGSRPRMCNRLDFATSGLMLVGKNRKAAGKASCLFQQRRVLKTYLALVLGHPPASWEKGVVLNYRITDTAGFARKAVNSMEDTTGRTTETAETSVRVLKRGLWPPKPWQASFGGCGEGSQEEVTREPLPASLVEVSPKTGRRHQIRVHLAAAGHP
ncbi:Rpusd1, partial [Symbiodinium sp. CCMP2456]